MIEANHSTRRGIAMLIVLAAMVVMLTLAAGAARLAAMSSLQLETQRNVAVADRLLISIEEPLIHWLEHESRNVVLSDDAISPCMTVIHDAWVINDVTVKVELTAWDQLGMVPLELATAGSPLRLALPRRIIAAIDATPSVDDTTHGLDLFDPGDGISIFPKSPPGEPTVFGESDSAASHRADGIDDDELPGEVALGALVATHNRGPFRININTAPMTLVEAALRAEGRGGVEVIRNNRRDGVLTPGAPQVRRGDDGQRVHIVSSSDVWAFRIDITINRTRRSWWQIFTRDPAPPEQRRSDWLCTQRILITDPSE